MGSRRGIVLLPSTLHLGILLPALVLVVVPVVLVSAQPLIGEELRPGQEVEGALEAGGFSCRLDLPAGAAWAVRVAQQGVDLVVTVADGEGILLTTIDGPAHAPFEETLLLTADTEGRRYQLEVRSAGDLESGGYRLWIEDVSAAPARRRAAEAAMHRAGEIYPRDTNEDWRAAQEIYRQALELWRQLDRPREEALTLYNLAVIHLRLSEYRPALEFYEPALERWRQLGETRAVATCLNDMGVAHWRLGEIEQARTRLEEALALQRQGEGEVQAVTLNNLCLLSHSQGALREAIRCYDEVLELARRRQSRSLEAVLLNNLAYAYDSLGEPRQAKEYHEAGLALRRTLGNPLAIAQSLNNLAVHHRRLGEAQQALTYYAEVLDIQRQLGNGDLEANALNNIGYAYYTLGDLDRARSYYRQALAVWQRLEDRRGQVRALNNMGNVAFDLGELSEARQLLESAYHLAVEGGDDSGRVSALHFLAQTHIDQGDLAAAGPLLDEALESLKGDERPGQRAAVLYQRARTRLAAGRTEEALEDLNRCLEIQTGIGDRPAQVTTLILAARAERARGHWPEARQRAESAVDLLESLRGEVINPQLRATFLSSRREAYELLVEVEMALHRAEPQAGHDHRALEINEHARARALLDLVGELGESSGSGGRLTEGVPADLLASRDEVRRRLNAQANRQVAAQEKGDAEEAARAAHERFAALTELDLLEAQIRLASPRYAALTQPPGSGLETIQGLLDDDTWLLEYALGAESGTLWLVTRERVESFPLPGRAEIETAARTAYDELNRLDLRQWRHQDIVLEQLAELVLGPLRQRLRGQRLVIVADGALQYVPFAALPGLKGEPLLVDHEVVYLPSASVLAAQRRQVEARPVPPGILMVLADPVFSRDDPRLASVAPAAPDTAVAMRERGAAEPAADTLERLPASRREAEAIAALVPSQQVRTALGFAASRATALEPAMGEYRILHFATHGLLNTEHPELSGIVLSRLDPEGRPVDGFLRLHDVYGLRLAADLVVLSGCQTALGEELKGEGLVGLTRGFMYAGASRVISSLWRVPDEATADLMVYLYTAMLQQGERPAAALRAAQLEVYRRRTWSDPYHWAAFVLQGDWR